jgi:small-conductance mechanosensitive channel
MALPFLQFPEWLTVTVRQGLTLWLIGSFSWLILRILAMTREIILSRYRVNGSNKFEARRVSTQIKVFERIVASVVVVLTIALMLMTFQGVRQIGVSILASAGVIGLVIGFAAQKSLGTILAGLQIALTQPIRLEDSVLVEGGVD